MSAGNTNAAASGGGLRVVGQGTYTSGNSTTTQNLEQPAKFALITTVGSFGSSNTVVIAGGGNVNMLESNGAGDISAYGRANLSADGLTLKVSGEISGRTTNWLAIG